MMSRAFMPSRAMPNTSGATAETVALYRRLIDLGRRSTILLGASDMLAGDVATYPSPTFYGTQEVFGAVAACQPSMLSVEYHDSAWSTRYGSTGTDYVRAQIIAAANAGKAIALHHHPGNPVTGSLAGVGTQWPPVGAGSCYDTTGTPLPTLLSGGANDAAFLAHLDRLATFLATLIDSRGQKIPVVLRWLHECNGGSFWWGTNSTSYVQVWQRMVAYLRDTKGVTNALYCINWSTDSAALSAWYPGDTYCDVLSLDHYDYAGTPTFSAGGKFAAAWAAMQAINSTKPAVIGEMGYENNANSPVIWSSSVQALATTYRRAAAVSLWRTPWGPSASDSASLKADFAAACADIRTLVL